MKQSLKIASAAALLAMASATGANAQRSTAEDEWFECWPAEIAVFSGRAHIGCRFSLGESAGADVISQLFAGPVRDVRFFAVPASDARFTSPTITLGQAAITGNRSIWIAFDRFDFTGEAYGCRIEDCRPIRGLKLKQATP